MQADAYVQGFTDKCATCGVDAEALFKHAAAAGSSSPMPSQDTVKSPGAKSLLGNVTAPAVSSAPPPATGRLAHIGAMSQVAKTGKLTAA